MAEEESSLLVVVISTNPSAHLMKNENILTHCLDGVIVFCHSHLMMSPRNKLAVIACHTHKSCFLYPQPDGAEAKADRAKDGQYELFAEVKSAITENIKKLILESSQEAIHTESLLAGAMSMALCYIHRLQREYSTTKLSSRILVVTASGDSASQYTNFMNVFFTAQKQGVIIDACILEKDAGLLQQGCDITEGLYLKVPNIAAFLQYLLWVFLPDISTRKEMMLPPQAHVDYRTACFCHRNLIEIGYVCSVCFSIFCTFSPICSTCQTAFKLGPIPPLKVKKRKKQI